MEAFSPDVLLWDLGLDPEADLEYLAELSMMTGPDVGMAVPVHEVKVFLRDAVGSQRRVA